MLSGDGAYYMTWPPPIVDKCLLCHKQDPLLPQLVGAGCWVRGSDEADSLGAPEMKGAHSFSDVLIKNT